MHVVTFPADEHEDSATHEIPVGIPVVDDNIDENRDQHFIVLMEVVAPTNLRLLSISTNVSVCTIVDNEDGECMWLSSLLWG